MKIKKQDFKNILFDKEYEERQKLREKKRQLANLATRRSLAKAAFREASENKGLKPLDT